MAQPSIGDCFMGSVTVGERGQIVIPAEARTLLNIRPGEKLLLMKHPIHKGLLLAKFEDMRYFLDDLVRVAHKVKQLEENEE